MPQFLVTIPIYHTLLVDAPNVDAALDSAKRTPYTQWVEDDCQPNFDKLVDEGSINILEEGQ